MMLARRSRPPPPTPTKATCLGWTKARPCSCCAVWRARLAASQSSGSRRSTARTACGSRWKAGGSNGCSRIVATARAIWKQFNDGGIKRAGLLGPAHEHDHAIVGRSAAAASGFQATRAQAAPAGMPPGLARRAPCGAAVNQDCTRATARSNNDAPAATSSACRHRAASRSRSSGIHPRMDFQITGTGSCTTQPFLNVSLPSRSGSRCGTLPDSGRRTHVLSRHPSYRAIRTARTLDWHHPHRDPQEALTRVPPNNPGADRRWNCCKRGDGSPARNWPSGWKSICGRCVAT